MSVKNDVKTMREALWFLFVTTVMLPVFLAVSVYEGLEEWSAFAWRGLRRIMGARKGE